jgi:hypothetical protein
VTEEDKDLSWEERKQQAFEHIADFSNESLMVKAADIVSNVSEMLDDFEKEGNEIFKRFKATKEQTIDHQQRIISAIIDTWPKNPLSGDLAVLAQELQLVRSK